MKKIAFILNGSKKSSKKLKRFFDQVEEDKTLSNSTIHRTQKTNHAQELAKDLAKENDIIIAIGGDGTLNEVVNGIIESNEEVILGLMPYGTANDFARAFNLKLDAKFLSELILNDRLKTIDIGEIHLPQSAITKYFINIADIGLGGFVADEITHSKSNFFKGKLKYFKAIIKGFRKYAKPAMKISGDIEYEGKILSLALCNSCYFADGLCINPDAKVDDQLLHITLIGNVSTRDYLKNLKAIKKGKFITHPEIKYLSGNKLSINIVEEPCPIEIDGEFLGYTPAEVNLIPKRLKIYLP